jgi:hypothetical protein
LHGHYGDQKAKKYTYYRCTGSRGKCELPYFREEELGNRLGQILKDIYIPDHVLSQLVESLLLDEGCETSLKQDQEQRLQQRLTSVRNRLDQAYLDKLDGKISEDLWIRKNAEWQVEEQQVQTEIRAVGEIKPERMLDAVKILELANKAYFLYVKQSPSEKAKLLNLVVSNCAIDAASVYPTYRKPFEVIFAKGKNEGWRAREDSNLCPCAPAAQAPNRKSSPVAVDQRTIKDLNITNLYFRNSDERQVRSCDYRAYRPLPNSCFCTELAKQVG